MVLGTERFSMFELFLGQPFNHHSGPFVHLGNLLWSVPYQAAFNKAKVKMLKNLFHFSSQLEDF